MAIPAAAAAAAYDPLLDENAAADFLQMSAKTLRKWRCVGGGPSFVKVGRCVRYERSALDAFVCSGRRASTSQDAGVGDARPA